MIGCYQGRCCGRMGASDWLTNSFIQNMTVTNPDIFPCSCFNSSNLTATSPWCAEYVTVPEWGIGQGRDLHGQVIRRQAFICRHILVLANMCVLLLQGCEKQISDWLQQNILTIVGMNLSLLLMQVTWDD